MMAVEAMRDRRDDIAAREHADLDSPNRQIRENRIELSGNKFGRDLVDGGDTFGVLGGERGDHARAVNAERRKSLEVRLNAGAAAGIRARDGERNRGHPLNALRRRRPALWVRNAPTPRLPWRAVHMPLRSDPAQARAPK